MGKMNQIEWCDWLPERARWSRLASSGLPAVSPMKNFPESHIINPLLTKLVRSRWLNIGLVLSCEFMDRFVSVHRHAEKDLANIQPSWPHTWSITHTSCPLGMTRSVAFSRNKSYVDRAGQDGWNIGQDFFVSFLVFRLAVFFVGIVKILIQYIR